MANACKTSLFPRPLVLFRSFCCCCCCASRLIGYRRWRYMLADLLGGEFNGNSRHSRGIKSICHERSCPRAAMPRCCGNGNSIMLMCWRCCLLYECVCSCEWITRYCVYAMLCFLQMSNGLGLQWRCNELPKLAINITLF